MAETPKQRRRRLERARQQAAREARTRLPALRWWQVWWKGLATIVSGLIGFIGLVGFLIGLFSDSMGLVRVSISPLEPMDANKPFSLPFTMVNGGHLTVYDVVPSCKVNDASVGGYHINDFTSYFPGEMQRVIKPDDGAPTVCRALLQATNEQTRSADIEIIVRFRTWWRTNHQSTYRIKASRDSANRLRWTQYPSTTPRTWPTWSWSRNYGPGTPNWSN